MKKIWLWLLFFVNWFAYTYDLDTAVFNDFDRVTWDFFKGTLKELIYTSNDDSYIKNIYKYEVIDKGAYDLFILDDGRNKKEYISLLHPRGDFFLVYSNEKNEPLYNGFFSKNGMLYLCDYSITADSYLIEGIVKYLPENLMDISIGKPWVEGIKGPGIGSQINIVSKEKISKLVISNGFVSRKISTYYNNNRVKKLKILNSTHKNEFMIVTLPDYAKPVEIELTFSSSNIQLEIVDIYKGEKFDDTCINFILCK